MANVRTNNIGEQIGPSAVDNIIMPTALNSFIDKFEKYFDELSIRTTVGSNTTVTNAESAHETAAGTAAAGTTAAVSGVEGKLDTIIQILTDAKQNSIIADIEKTLLVIGSLLINTSNAKSIQTLGALLTQRNTKLSAAAKNPNNQNSYDISQPAVSGDIVSVFKSLIDIAQNAKLSTKDAKRYNEAVKLIIQGTIDILKDMDIDDPDIKKKQESLHIISLIINDISVMNQLFSRMRIRNTRVITAIINSIAEEIKIITDVLFSALNDMSAEAVANAKNTSETIQYINDIIDSLNSINKKLLITAVTLPVAIVGIPLLALELMEMKLVMKVLSGFDPATSMAAAQTVSDIKQITEDIAITNILLAGVFLTVGIAIPGIIALTVELAMLAGMLRLIAKIGGDAIKEPMEGIKNIAELVVIAAGVVLLGALVGGLVWKRAPEIFKFGVVLTGMILLIALAGGIARALIRSDISDAFIKLAVLITVCATILIIAGTIVAYYPEIMSGAIAFAILLGLFIGALLVITGVVTHFAKEDVKDSFIGLAVLIGISALCLIVPGLIVANNPGVLKASLEFTGILTGFLLSLLIPIGILMLLQSAMNLSAAAANGTSMSLSKLLGGRIPIINSTGSGTSSIITTLLGISLLVLVSGGIILYAGNFMLENPGIEGKMWQFVVMIDLLLVGVGGIIFTLSKLNSEGTDNLWIMLGICGVLLSIGYSMKMLCEGIKDVDWGVLLIAMGGITLVMLSIGAIINTTTFAIQGVGKTGALAICGLILSIALAFVGIGYGMKLMGEGLTGVNWGSLLIAMLGVIVVINIMATIIKAGMVLFAVGAVLGGGTAGGAAAVGVVCGLLLSVAATIVALGAAFYMIGEFAKTVNSIQDVNWEALGFVAAAIASFGVELSLLGLIYQPLLLGSSAALLMGTAITSLAMGLKVITELQVDPEEAATKVSNIVTCLGGALKKVYNNPDNKGMFDYDSLVSWFAGNPMIRVIKSCSMMGDMIAKIAEGVQKMANLEVTYHDDTGKEITRQLKAEDFQLAALNIGSIVRCIGCALEDIYAGSPEMFEIPDFNLFNPKTWTDNDNKFMKVLKSCTAMGDMIGVIGEGVSRMANLEVSWHDDQGNVHYRPLNDGDFDLAAIGIYKVVTCLGKAIEGLYDDPVLKPMFALSQVSASDNLFQAVQKLTADTPFVRVLKSCAMMGNMIKDIADGVSKMANFEIQYHDKDGKVHYRHAYASTFIKAGDNIRIIITSIINGIMDAYKGHKAIFEDENLIGGWLGKVVNTKERGTSPVSKVITAVTNIAKAMGNMADLIQRFAVLNEIPMTGADGKTYYKTIGSIDDFVNTVPANINTILTSLINGIYTVASDKRYKDFFNDTYDEEDNPLYKVLNFNKKMCSSLGNVADIIMQFSGNSIPTEYDKDGNPVKFTRFSTSMQKTAAANIASISTTLMNAFIEVSKSINGQNISIDNTGNVKILANAMVDYMSVAAKAGIILSMIAQGEIHPLDENGNPTQDGYTLNEGDADKAIQILKVINRGFVGRLQYLNKQDFLKDASHVLVDNMESAVKVYARLLELYSEAHVNNDFDQVTRDTDSFIKTINALNVKKADRMISLIHALSKLSDKVGGMDKLANTLAEKLSTVLVNLQRQLAITTNMMSSADKLHSKRVKDIQDNIQAVKSIMQLPILVAYTSSGEGSPASNETGTSGTAATSANMGTGAQGTAGGATGNVGSSIGTAIAMALKANGPLPVTMKNN